MSFFSKDVIIFTFFLFLSFIFWCLNSLGKVIETDIKYPVRYINSQKDLMLEGNPPSKISLYLKGPGYSIIKLKLSANRAPAIIDLARVTYKKNPNQNSSGYFIVSSGLIRSFTRQLGPDIEIVSIKPDTIFIRFDRVNNR